MLKASIFWTRRWPFGQSIHKVAQLRCTSLRWFSRTNQCGQHLTTSTHCTYADRLWSYCAFERSYWFVVEHSTVFSSHQPILANVQRKWSSSFLLGIELSCNPFMRTYRYLRYKRFGCGHCKTVVSTSLIRVMSELHGTRAAWHVSIERLYRPCLSALMGTRVTSRTCTLKTVMPLALARSSHDWRQRTDYGLVISERTHGIYW